MDKKMEEKKNTDGTKTIIQTTETTPEDGFVHQADINDTNMDNYGKYHKGYSKNISISTSDPRITRPFAYGMCGLFFAIGVFLLLLHDWVFGIIFIASAISVFIKAKKDIDKIEAELKKQPKYINTDPKDVQKEFIESIGEGWNDAKKSTFTKANFKYFARKTIPLYCIITIIIFFLIAFFVNIILGLFILGILILCGFIYYWIVSKICKW